MTCQRAAEPGGVRSSKETTGKPVVWGQENAWVGSEFCRAASEDWYAPEFGKLTGKLSPRD